MCQQDSRELIPRELAAPLERLAQANVALVLAQVVIIRLSVTFGNYHDDDPAPLMLLGFLATCGVAGALVVALSRVLRRFPRRWLRITLAIASLMVQATAFQLIHAWAS